MLESKSKVNFHPVDNPKLLISVLESRLPHSCFIYNLVISCEKSKALKFYIVGASTERNCSIWIVLYYLREDGVHKICISAPTEIINGSAQIPPEIKECFQSNGVLNWDESLEFVALEKPISAMIFDISANIEGNVTNVHPGILYYVEKEEALKIPEISLGREAQITRLCPETGTDFILSTWNYVRKGSRALIHNAIKSNASVGIVVDSKIVSGVVSFGGLLRCLYTQKEYRNRGYGKLVMKYMFKEFAKEGCIPCSTVDIKNKRSIAFHESLGAKPVCIMNGINIKKLEVD